MASSGLTSLHASFQLELLLVVSFTLPYFVFLVSLDRDSEGGSAVKYRVSLGRTLALATAGADV